MKHVIWVLLICVLLCTAALADPVEVTSLDLMPEADMSGFLPEGTDAAYYQNFREGHWLYLSNTERIEVTRVQTQKPLLTYYIADIRTDGAGMFLRNANVTNPGHGDVSPKVIAQRERVVLAISGDFYTYRVKQNRYPGHIVREGKVLYSKSYTKMVYALPNLATLGFYPDGHMEVNQAWEKTAQEYVDDGATDVVAFGPILIRDGEIQDIDHETYTYKEPRCCFGMVEPGHYVAMLVEGRKDHSKGATMLMCAQLMYDQGCTLAINMDGGGTAAMIFMGQSVQMTNNGSRDEPKRYVPDIICAGLY